jgi:hypothetical protein
MWRDGFGVLGRIVRSPMTFPTSLLASLSASSVRWAETLLSILMNRRSVSKTIARTQPRGARGQDADQAGSRRRGESRSSRNYGSYYIIIPRVVARDDHSGGRRPSLSSIPEPTLPPKSGQVSLEAGIRSDHISINLDLVRYHESGFKR